MRSRGKDFVCYILLLIGIFALTGCSNVINHLNKSFPEGTMVDDCDLSGLKEKEALMKLEEWASDKLEQKIKLVYNETEEQISLKDLGAKLDTESVLKDLNDQSGKPVKSKLSFSKDEAVLDRMYESFSEEPVNATFKIENHAFIVVPAKDGFKFNYEKTVDKLKDISLLEIPEMIEVAVDVVTPNITTEKMESLGFYELISQFETKYNVNEVNRSSNLALAAKAFNNKLIKPNEIVSFNETVGPRTPERGYKDAYIIINNEFVEGIGGGICQVTSTLYNAALLADLKIVERYPHAVAVNYVPLGQDATVNYPNIDFKFQNPYSHYLYMRVDVGEGTLRFSIYGQKMSKKVKIMSVVIDEVEYQTTEKWDSNLAPGQQVVEQKGTKGYTVVTYKIIQQENGQVIKEQISKDVYQPSNKVVRVGPVKRDPLY